MLSHSSIETLAREYTSKGIPVPNEGFAQFEIKFCSQTERCFLLEIQPPFPFIVKDTSAKVNTFTRPQVHPKNEA